MLRSSLSTSSSHYSLLMIGGGGMANQYRTCPGCLSYHVSTTSYSPNSVWLRVTKVGNVLTSYYKPTWSSYWYQFGAMLSISDIKSHGYFAGLAVSSHTNEGVAKLDASNIQLTRTCSETAIEQQCTQASNCEWGDASGSCYRKGEVPYWEYGQPEGSILDSGSTVDGFGCKSNDLDNWATDGSTASYFCERDASPNAGLVITPFHGRLSIAHGLRVYAANNCPSCEPVAYRFEGRIDANSNWILIGEGDLPWKETGNAGNNIIGLDISSTYYSGDSRFVYTEVSRLH